MGIKLADLSGRARTLAVEYDGMTVNVAYNPGRISMKTQSRISFAQEQSAGVANAELAETLGSVIESWDILGDDDKPLPVTPDLVQELPLGFVGALTTAVFEDINPNSNGRRSSGT